MAKILGTVISSLNGPSTSEFDFVINDNPNSPAVRKGQFVQIKTEDGLMIARVDEIMKTNRYFMQAESVREYERSGNSVGDMFPVDRWEYLVAKCFPLGICSGNLTSRVVYPPSPGSKVEEVDENILSTFLGFQNSFGLHIGKLAFHNLDVKLNITRLFQKHLAILAMSGSGKSYLTSVLIEELLDRDEKLGKPAVIVIDPHGEYKKFAEDPFYRKYVKVFKKDEISIGVSTLSPSQIAELIPEMSSPQRRELQKIVDGIDKKNYDFSDLIKAIETSDTKTVTKDTIIGWLTNLKMTGLFSKYTRPSIDNLAKCGQLSILDLSDFVRLNEKQLIVTYFARKLFNGRREGKIPPFILIVEESHQFCPEGVKKEGAISKGILETIAREGRKFHASLVLISQRPIQLSTTVLSQCNTHIILRVVNPYDLQHIGESSEGITSDVLKSLPGLRVGEALIVGEAVNFPILVKVRERKSKKSNIEKTLEDALLEYTKKSKLDEKDIETFM